MNMHTKIKLLAVSVLLVSFILMASPNVGSTEILCPEMKLIREIDSKVNDIHKKILNMVENTVEIMKNSQKDKNNHPKPTPKETFDGLMCKLKKVIMKLDSEQIAMCSDKHSFNLMKGTIESFKTNAILYTTALRILNEERRDDAPYTGYFRFSHVREYSLAYSGFKQSLTVLLLHAQNLKNFSRTSGQLNDVGGDVKTLLKYHKKKEIGLSLNFFSGLDDEGSFNYAGLNYCFDISKSKRDVLIIPELGIDFSGKNHLVSSASIAKKVTDSFYLFAGGDVRIPKSGDVKAGGHFGMNFVSVRPLIIGLRYSSLFGLGLRLTILL